MSLLILWKRFINFTKLFLLLLCISTLNANKLQDAIDGAPIGATIKLSNSSFYGNIIIDKPLTIVGIGDNVVIDGNNSGSVITINSSNVILKNLIIINSGDKMTNIDSGIKITKVKNSKIISCKILNSLYGIDISMVENSIFKNNYITSKNIPKPLKGDGLKIWYSNNNVFSNNILDKTRDVTLSYSSYNTFNNNLFKNNRFALHISHSNNNRIKNNTFKYNSVAIMIMGAKDTNVTKNIINSSTGAAGIGILIKGVSSFILQHNNISYNAQGIYIDSKATEETMSRYIYNNIISYNKEAIHFHSIIKNNTIKNNKIYGNIDDIVKSTRGFLTRNNIVEYNYWDRYSGFDENGDNIGDTTHKIYQYADQLWHYNHKVKFFYASPIMSMLNFLTKLAPFVEPVFLLEDTKPIVKYNQQP